MHYGTSTQRHAGMCCMQHSERGRHGCGQSCHHCRLKVVGRCLYSTSHLPHTQSVLAATAAFVAEAAAATAATAAVKGCGCTAAEESQALLSLLLLLLLLPSPLFHPAVAPSYPAWHAEAGGLPHCCRSVRAAGGGVRGAQKLQLLSQSQRHRGLRDAQVRCRLDQPTLKPHGAESSRRGEARWKCAQGCLAAGGGDNFGKGATAVTCALGCIGARPLLWAPTSWQLCPRAGQQNCPALMLAVAPIGSADSRQWRTAAHSPSWRRAA